MNDALHAPKPAGSAGPQGPTGPHRFVQFDFLRADTRFHTLQSNEKVVARQEFLSAFESLQRQSAAVAYSLTGLRADCDVLLWRHAENLEILQAASERLRGAGLGRYLVPAHSFLTLGADASAAPRARLLFVRPSAWTPEWRALSRPKREELLAERARLAARHTAVRTHVFESFSVESHERVFAYETDHPLSYLELQRELEDSPVGAYLRSGIPVFPCIHKDVRDLVEGLE